MQNPIPPGRDPTPRETQRRGEGEKGGGNSPPETPDQAGPTDPRGGREGGLHDENGIVDVPAIFV